TYDWDGTSDTVLYVYGNGIATIETDTVHSGTQSLRFEEDPLSGTPQACVAWIRDLADGDVVTASFWVYDVTPAASPSGRIWGHWNDSADPDSVTNYDGSAGGNSTYSSGAGWDQLEWEWTVADGHTGLIIEARIYSSTGANVLWFDDLSITAPDGASFILPGTEVSLQRNSWGAIKAAF
ncbi:MAG: hypothetical protein KAH31_01360, partial [Candidatus Sabulitectum sp.]|nr:hypothetical protein [Candidatus Sabulitectum sp.]